MKNYHLYAIGNALVDSEFEVTDALLEQAGVAKRHMTLIDAPRRAELLALAGHRHGKQTGGERGNHPGIDQQFGEKPQPVRQFQRKRTGGNNLPLDHDLTIDS